MKKEIHIGGKPIGPGHDIFLSCEVGTTHNGEFDKAVKIIEGAAYAGVDAVKFQIIGPEEIHSDKSKTYTYTTYDGETKTENEVELLKKYKFTLPEWKRLKELAESKGLIFFATVDYPGAIDIAEELQVPAYKICSWDMTYYPFIRRIARIGKPVVLDTGPIDTEDLARVLKIFKEEGNEQVIVLHCFHTARPEEMNMRSIAYIKDTFDVLCGLSAADRNFDVDFMAIAFGPVMIEKRLTFDKTNKEHHHAQALEPEEMKEYVEKVKKVAKAVGRYGLFPSPGDIEEGRWSLRRIVANRDIAEGETFCEENIECKLPQEGGLHPLYYSLVLGKIAKRALKENEPITKEDIG